MGNIANSRLCWPLLRLLGVTRRTLLYAFHCNSLICTCSLTSPLHNTLLLLCFGSQLMHKLNLKWKTQHHSTSSRQKVRRRIVSNTWPSANILESAAGSIIKIVRGKAKGSSPYSHVWFNNVFSKMSRRQGQCQIYQKWSAKLQLFRRVMCLNDGQHSQ